jgi:hypothetical protein
MYTRTRNTAGGIFMTCKDCGHAISVNKMREKPIQAATDMLKHMVAHNASRAFSAVRSMRPVPEAVPIIELARDLNVQAEMDRFESPITQPTTLPQGTDSTGYSADQLRLSEALLIM